MISFQICPNGLICFGGKVQTFFIPRHGEFRKSFLGRSCLAPYFSDLNSRFHGLIYYRYIDALEDTSAPEIDVAKTLVNQNKADDIEPTFILITTWSAVPNYTYSYYYYYYYYYNSNYYYYYYNLYKSRVSTV